MIMMLPRRLSAVVFDLEWEMVLSRRVAAIVFQGFLYGFFTCVLLSALYLLCMNRRGVPWPLIFVMVAMYALSTADVSWAAFYLFRYVLNGREAPTLRPRPSALVFISNYALANSVLIYRCYLVWSRKRRILVVTVVPVLGLTVAGYILEVSPNLNLRVYIYLWATLGFNTCLALSTCARILWSARRASDVLGSQLQRKLYSIASVIIDSGAIYSVYLIFALTVKSPALRSGVNQVVGIVPTLVIVQISLSRYLEDLEDAASMRSAPGSRSASTPVLDSLFSMAANVTAPSLVPATVTAHAGGHAAVDAVVDAPEGSPPTVMSRDRTMP